MTTIYEQTQEWLKISEAECKELTAENERLSLENERLKETLKNQEDALHSCIESHETFERENERLMAELAELKAIIALIDGRFPLADDTCMEPGITLSEAARRELAEQGGIEK